jgi:hypothetical protein
LVAENDRTYALLGVEPLRELPRRALFATVFSNIILKPIENVPFCPLQPPFLALFAPFRNWNRTFCKKKF